MLLAEPKIRDGNDLRRQNNFSESEHGMAADEESGYKRSKTMDDLQEIEDRLAKIQGEFREIRNGMKTANMPVVKLALGSFIMRLERMESLVKKYKGEFGQQETELATQRTRERKRAEITARSKNQNRK